jgi:hypothetical protein
MAVLPGVLGCSFDRLRTGSPCDVPFRYASGPIPCGCPVARPSSSRSLRSAQSRKRVPSFVILRQQFMKYAGWGLFDEVGGREKMKNEKPLDSLTRQDRGARRKPPLTIPRRTLENIPSPSQTAYGGLGLSSPSYLRGSI